MELQDGSARDVAREVFRARNACSAGDAAAISAIAGTQSASVLAVGASASLRETEDGRRLPKGIDHSDSDKDDDDDDDDDSDDDEAPRAVPLAAPAPQEPVRQPRPEPDEDGFVTVTRRRGRR